ncbi:hypothetical protein Q0F98_14500 [Paenibacillus amylolyticus]|nr:hypothetical protein Q0F98_14500 [Paenibacillus amylolyticus]
MPNFTTFNTNPDNLRTLIFGQDSTGTAQPVRTDTERERGWYYFGRNHQ